MTKKFLSFNVGFGICFDLDIKHLDKTDIVGENCLIDRDPLLVFTISVRSLATLLAEVLLFGLDRIKDLFNNKVKVTFSSKITREMVMKGFPMGHLIKIGIMLILCLMKE